MQPAARNGDAMEGKVPHHAGHIIAWRHDGDGNSIPVYCQGHDVKGNLFSTSPNVFINGQGAARGDDLGTSDDACDQSWFQVVQGSKNVYINGKPMARQGDMVYLYPGEGKITTGSRNVFVGG